MRPWRLSLREAIAADTPSVDVRIRFCPMRPAVGIKSVCAMAKIAGAKEWQSKRGAALYVKLRQSAVNRVLCNLNPTSASP
jgi:hypothetical protein